MRFFKLKERDDGDLRTVSKRSHLLFVKINYWIYIAKTLLTNSMNLLKGHLSHNVLRELFRQTSCCMFSNSI